MSLEGDLRVGLGVSNGRIGAVRIGSTRPDVAHALLTGRSRAEVHAAVPRLFSVCGRSQGAASGLAWAAAAGEAIEPEMLARSGEAVAAELVRELAWRILLDWPQWLDERPDDAAVAAARSTLAVDAGARSGADAAAIARAAFGMAASEWLALRTLAELDRWLDAGPTAAARFVRGIRDDDAALADVDRSRPDVVLLDSAAAAAEKSGEPMTSDIEGDADRGATWRGAPAETGALARRHADPLIADLLRRSTTRVPARFVARLLELALFLDGRGQSVVGAQSLPSGAGVAWVENARGLLVHRVTVEAGRARSYRIVAPTDWNFHPRGVVIRVHTARARSCRSPAATGCASSTSRSNDID
ncbi:MAG: nickel-dependent hydrogenase large subunit, partial [Caldimonas sp.]